MHQFHGHCPFTHARSDAFGGTMTDIPSDENSGNARLKIKGVAVCGPSGGTFAVEHKMLPGNEVTLRISFDDSSEPIGSGNSARINQQRAGRHGFSGAIFVVLDRNLLATIS